MKKKLLIVSHAYLRNDIYQSLLFLNKKFNLVCLVPKNFKLFSKKKNKSLLKEIDTLYYKNKFFFKEKLSIIKKFNPNLIIIEYNPWSIIFIQIIFFLKIYNIKPKIILHIKDNKFVKYKYIKIIFFYLFKNNIDNLWFASSIAKKNFSNLFLKKKDKIRSYVIPIHPINTKFYKKKTNKIIKKNINYGFVGRPDFDKGFNYLINIFKKNKINNSTFTALLPPKKFWKDKNKILNFKNHKSINILIKKFNKIHVLNFYKKIDVLISPSIETNNYMEQDGQVVLEALSCENIAISSNTGFFKDIRTTRAFFKINKINFDNIYNKALYISKNLDKINNYRYENRLLIKKKFSLEVVNNKKIDILGKI